MVKIFLWIISNGIFDLGSVNGLGSWERQHLGERQRHGERQRLGERGIRKKIRIPDKKSIFTRVYVRTTRVYHLLCCCWSCSCSSWDISQNTAVYTKLVPFHHAFSILQCNFQF
jgi:hypothetical protein